MYLLYFAVIRLSFYVYKSAGVYSSLINNMNLSKNLYSLSCIGMNVVSIIKGVLSLLTEGAV